MDIIIAGGGISGLSCAWHLNRLGNKNFTVFEASSKTGGLCASYIIDGFTFDYSGHLLHLSTKQGMDIAAKLLGKNIGVHKRKAFVVVGGAQVPFPFQNNLYGLPEEMVSRCVNSALEAYKNKTFKRDGSFKNWALSLYGKEICDTFMFPYNTKLWQFDLAKLTDAWCGKFVPQSSLEDIIKGAYSRRRKDFGYNTTFFYPKKGGCGALCEALTSKTPNIETDSQIKQIDLKAKTVTVNGAKHPYKILVNTMPLNKLGKVIKGLPQDIKDCFAKLKHNTVKVINIAAEGKTKEGHWFYFPEGKYPFYRIGVQSSFATNNAPKDSCSFYVETGNTSINTNDIIAHMRALGFIEQEAQILACDTLTIKEAYPIYDADYAPCVKKIIDYLAQQNIYLLGRYGAWEYSFMEKSLLDGGELARKINAILNGAGI